MQLRYTPRVDDVRHATLQEKVNQYLSERDYSITSGAYHDIFDPEIVKLIQKRFTLQALYLRGRADRLAVNNRLPIEFEFELKTHHNNRYSDLCIEVLPFLHHQKKSQLGVDCLYIFEVNGVEGGFWVSEFPPIHRVNFPQRIEYRPIESIIKKFINDNLPDAKIYSSLSINGSGDPYLIVEWEYVKTAQDWKIMIGALPRESRLHPSDRA